MKILKEINIDIHTLDMTSLIVLAAAVLLSIIFIIMIAVVAHRHKQEIKTLQSIDKKMDLIPVTANEAPAEESETDEAQENIRAFFADTVVLSGSGGVAEKEDVITVQYEEEKQEEPVQGEKFINMGESGKVYSKEELAAQIKN